MPPDRPERKTLFSRFSYTKLSQQLLSLARITFSRPRTSRRYSSNFWKNWTLTSREHEIIKTSEELIKRYENGAEVKHLKKLTRKLLAELVSIFTDEDSLHVTQLGGAMTNRVFVCHAPGNDRVLLRLYGRGTELLFCREHELETFQMLSDLGYGPKLLGKFPQGRLEEYIECTSLKKHDFRDPDVSKEIALSMADLHKLIPVPEGTEAGLWRLLVDWLQKARSACQNLHDRTPSDWCPSAMVEDVANEIEILKSKLKSTSPVVFSHNDAQYGNLIRRKDNGALMLIDYEYAMFNYRGFDIGNHFCEWAADYDAENAHILDFSQYPTSSQQEVFVRAYLERYHPTFHQFSAHAQAQEIRCVMIEANQFSLASHLVWCLWGFIQAANSTIAFDFLEYSAQRFREYSLRRDYFLMLSPFDHSEI